MWGRMLCHRSHLRHRVTAMVGMSLRSGEVGGLAWMRMVGW
jgi:hypothetical protein